MNQYWHGLALTLGISLLAPAGAQSLSGDPTIGRVVVTAARVAQDPGDSTASVTVIGRDDIEHSQALDLPELLASQAGLEVINSGGTGKVSAIFLRGTNSDQTLVLIDGVKAGSASTGATALQDLPLDLIDHIEIVRGPQSGLYGSEAVGGVIQIFTRQGNGPARWRAALGVGSQGTWSTSSDVSGSFDNGVSYGVGVSGLDTQGFTDCVSNPNAGCYAVVAPNARDGYRNDAVRGQVGWHGGLRFSADLQWLHTHAVNRFEGSYVNSDTTGQDVLSLVMRGQLSDVWRSVLQLTQGRDLESDFLDGAWQDRFATRRRGASWQNELALGLGQTVVLGLDRQVDSAHLQDAYADPDFSVTTRTDTGVFAEYLLASGPQRWQINARGDQDSQFGRHGTGSLAWGYRLPLAWDLTASYGTAFKAPSFNDLYYPYYGNPLLKPEQAHSAELGVSRNWGRQAVALRVYQTGIADLIVSSPATNYLPYNVDSARIRGLEAQASHTERDWKLYGNASLTDPRNEGTVGNAGKLLARRARTLATLGAERQWRDWQVGARWHAEGARYDDPANTQRMGGFATLDLQAQLRWSSALRVQLAINNVLDHGYETVYLYNQPGRVYRLTLRYQP